ncbi:Ankyrin repeat domain-containing protein 26 [Camelus dromedarius]|uniref:Ankyrin repeat domain-containing protein 26 n=1 Tax=Camelus dromedarius TaxID=9838 RepID=A0A5N4C0G5_CAMDR|nr:Ankyrin repeat domain-containing protein 26 [Camelus dromedarius]
MKKRLAKFELVGFSPSERAQGIVRTPVPGYQPRTALHLACASGQSSGGSPYQRSVTGCCEGGKTALIKYNLTPFLLAIRKNKEEMVKFLIENGANVHAVDKLQRSALMLAVHHDSPDIVKLLLQKRVNVDSQDLLGWSAERYAYCNGFKHVTPMHAVQYSSSNMYLSHVFIHSLYQLIVDYTNGNIPTTPPQNSDLGQSSADLVVEVSPRNEDISVISVSPKRDIDDSRPPSDDDLALPPKGKASLANISDRLLKIQDPVDSFRSIELKESDCTRLRGELKEMEKKVNWLHTELLKTREAKSQLKLQNMEWERELRHMRSKMNFLFSNKINFKVSIISLQIHIRTRNKEEEKCLYIIRKTEDDLKKKEKQDNEQVFLKQQIESTARALECKPKGVRNKPNQVLEERNELRDNVLEAECRVIQDDILAHHLSQQKETEKANKEMNAEAHIRQLQQELTDTRKRVSMLEASLEVTAHHKTNSENKRRDGERKSHQTANPVRMKFSTSANADLPAKEESTSSVVLHLSAETQLLLKELLPVKEMQRKCEALEEEKKKLEEEAVNLRRHLEMNPVERSQVEHYKREPGEQARRDAVEALKELRRAVQHGQETEEQARHDVVEKLKEISQFLQAQAGFQENVLREYKRASVSQTEHRVKDLEPELKSDSNENKLEKYKQLYLKELENRKSLSSQLTSVNERLAEVSTELLLERQHKRSFPGFVPARPVGGPPSAAGTSVEAKRSPTRRRNFRTFSDPSTT